MAKSKKSKPAPKRQPVRKPAPTPDGPTVPVEAPEQAEQAPITEPVPA